MAWYEVSTASMAEAEETIESFAVDLQTLKERLDNIQFEQHGSTHIMEQRKGVSARMADVCACTKHVGKALSEIISTYKSAEQRAFNGDGGQMSPTSFSTPPPVVSRQTQGILFSNDLVTPDWLQAAVVKYEQSVADGQQSVADEE